MNYVIRCTCFEFLKTFFGRAWIIVFGIVAVIQPLLALLEATQLAQTGIHATPETNPELVQALPPLDYFGFDVTAFGQLPIVVLGALMGASEYKGHELRTTFLCLNKRMEAFLAKIAVVFAGSMIASFVAIFTTIAVTHVGLGKQGLNPLILSPIAWQFIGYVLVDWVLLTLLSFGLGMLSRNAIVPLVFMIPQIFNLGNLLAQKWEWGKYFPVAAGNLLFSSPTDALAHQPIKGGLILSLWTGIILILAAYRFVRSDVGGIH